jgi:hypothetical protein
VKRVGESEFGGGDMGYRGHGKGISNTHKGHPRCSRMLDWLGFGSGVRAVVVRHCKLSFHGDGFQFWRV